MEENLQGLIDLLRQLAPEILAIYVRQAYIAGTTWIILGTLTLIATIYLGRYSFRFICNHQTNFGHGDYDVLYYALTGLTMAIVVPTSIIWVTDGVMRLLNPEFFAIQSLLGR